ncbi:hypothetical protein Droror1_Dr00007064 [Drosera rotundifolia]
MESHLCTSSALLAITKTLKSTTTTTPLSRLHLSTNHRRLLARSLLSRSLLRHQCSTGATVSSLRYLCAVLLPSRSSLACLSAASFSTGGGGEGGKGDVSGGGGEGGGGGDERGVGGASAADDVGALSGDVIILDVGGMTCGGCAASVKRILESQPQVFSATVNLTTDTAIVWPVSEAKTAADWQRQIGEMLAKHLTNCGFQSNMRGLGANEEDIQ